MGNEIPWRGKLFLKNAVKTKCQEFHEKGYIMIDESDIWQYLTDYRWKKTIKRSVSEKKLDIKKVTFNDYFDYQRIKAQTKPNNQFDWHNMTDIL